MHALAQLHLLSPQQNRRVVFYRKPSTLKLPIKYRRSQPSMTTISSCDDMQHDKNHLFQIRFLVTLYLVPCRIISVISKSHFNTPIKTTTILCSIPCNCTTRTFSKRI